MRSSPIRYTPPYAFSAYFPDLGGHGYFEQDLFHGIRLKSYAVTQTLKKLSREFYLREDTVCIAKDLLGKLLVVPAGRGTRVSGMIVETEAYLGVADKAAHSYGGRRTARNEITYAEGGHVYVF